MLLAVKKWNIEIIREHCYIGLTEVLKVKGNDLCC